MPRIRSIKPEIHQDEVIGELSDSAFRVFVALITLADDAGRLKGDPALVSSQVWPYAPKTPDATDQLLEELAKGDLIVRYSHGGRRFISLTSWEKHQRVDNAGKSAIPSPSESDGGDPPQSAASRGEPPLERRGEEGRGEERRGVAAERDDAPLSNLLADLIEQNGSNRPFIGKTWKEAERLLLERDERDPAEAERLIRWCQADEFWRANVLSMTKFRTKYDQLRLQAGRTSSKPKGSRVDDRVSELLTRAQQMEEAA